MATYKKRGSSYRIRASVGYTPEGKQVMKSKTWTPTPGMTERQIEKELNRQMVLFDEECRGSSLTDGHIKFETFAQQWMKEYVEKALGKRTQASYAYMSERIYAALGHLYMDKITPRQIQKFINSLSEPGANETHPERGLSPKSVKNFLSMISAVFAYAIKMGMLQYNPWQSRHAAASGYRKGEAVLHHGGGSGVPGCACRRPSAVAGIFRAGPVWWLPARRAVRLRVSGF